MSDFATTLRAAIVADPEAATSWRGRRIVNIIDSPESPWRTRRLNRWQEQSINHAVHHGYSGDLLNVNWDEVWNWIGRVATLLGLLLMLIPLLAPAPGAPDEVVERLRKVCDEQYMPGVHDPIMVFPLSDIDHLLTVIDNLTEMQHGNASPD